MIEDETIECDLVEVTVFSDEIMAINGRTGVEFLIRDTRIAVQSAFNLSVPEFFNTATRIRSNMIQILIDGREILLPERMRNGLRTYLLERPDLRPHYFDCHEFTYFLNNLPLERARRDNNVFPEDVWKHNACGTRELKTGDVVVQMSPLDGGFRADHSSTYLDRDLYLSKGGVGNTTLIITSLDQTQLCYGTTDRLHLSRD